MGEDTYFFRNNQNLLRSLGIIGLFASSIATLVVMKLYVKNMVCNRCIMVMKNELETAGIRFSAVELGEITLVEKPSEKQLQQWKERIQQLGFESIDDKKSRIAEKIKNHIVSLVHHSTESIKVNLSVYLSEKLQYDYSYLSNLFSEVTGKTIEKYVIEQKVEKVKELLVYDELTISEIAEKLGYSSVAYLSGQFKKITGHTPSFYKSLKEHKRKRIEDV